MIPDHNSEPRARAFCHTEKPDPVQLLTKEFLDFKFVENN